MLETLGLKGWTGDQMMMTEHECRVCGCNDNDCFNCYFESGEPCFWVEPDLCSNCARKTPSGYKLHSSGLVVPEGMRGN